MGLFSSREEKEEKKVQEMKKIIKKYKLENLDENDLIVLRKIAIDLAEGEIIKTSMLRDEGNLENKLNITYLGALVEQNWMFIRQFDKLNKNIEKLLKR